MLRNVYTGGDRVAVLDRLMLLESSDPARWGVMNAHEMVCHLSDAFSWALGRRPTNDTIDMPLPGVVLRWIALRLPLPWPKGTPTLPAADQKREGTPPEDFQADRQRLVGLIEEFSADPSAIGAETHPIMGKLTEGDWGRWAFRHCDHHLRQFGR